VKAAVLGTTGYTGMILLRLLIEHPEVDKIIPVSSSKPGVPLSSIDPGLGVSGMEKTKSVGGETVSIEKATKLNPDVVFSALPHLASARTCEPFFGKSIVIDLSADFRIKDAELFRKSYGEPPPRVDLLDRAVYGLCEVYRDEIRKADIIANPGCYPTATLLPLYPLFKNNLIEKGRIVINALSGISGAGKKAELKLLFCERSENTSAYSPGSTHRHAGEIQQRIKEFAGIPKGYSLAADSHDFEVLFTPHMVPLKRGMFITTTVSLAREIENSELNSIFLDAYTSSPFISLTFDYIPQTRDVWGSNRCDIGWHLEGRTLILFSVIDNLIKGASGQAIQNLNIRFGFIETAGLRSYGEI